MGANVPFYGSLFRNFEMTKDYYEDINNNLIPEEYKI